MTAATLPLQLLLLTVSGWVHRHQQDVIAYLVEENRVLKEQLGGRKLRLTDDQRRRLAAKARLLGRRALDAVATLVTPDTLMGIVNLASCWQSYRMPSYRGYRFPPDVTSHAVWLYHASRSASETWRTCWPAGVSTSPMRPSGSGVGGSVLSMRADYGADVAGSETPGISTRCSSRSRVASSTCGAPWMRPVTSSTSSCNRDEIGTPRCASFASC